MTSACVRRGCVVGLGGGKRFAASSPGLGASLCSAARASVSPAVTAALHTCRVSPGCLRGSWHPRAPLLQRGVRLVGPCWCMVGCGCRFWLAGCWDGARSLLGVAVSVGTRAGGAAAPASSRGRLGMWVWRWHRLWDWLRLAPWREHRPTGTRVPCRPPLPAVPISPLAAPRPLRWLPVAWLGPV